MSDQKFDKNEAMMQEFMRVSKTDFVPLASAIRAFYDSLRDERFDESEAMIFTQIWLSDMLAKMHMLQDANVDGDMEFYCGEDEDE